MKFKQLILWIVFILIANSIFAQTTKDYTLYHKGIINAEEAIFIQHDPTKGLQLFKTSFDNYEFVFIDDCIEAFQLALYFKRDDLAMLFIKKAIENGFEIKLLNHLNLGCPCNYYKDMRVKVCVQDAFIAKNGKYLEEYAATTYGKYIKRLNKEVILAEIKRHVKEQLFKNRHPELGFNEINQKKEYSKICDDNLSYIDGMGQQNNFPGEWNIGIYTQKFCDSLHLPFKNIEKYAAKEINSYRLPSTVEIPHNTESDYFEKGIVYNILFHNAKSYDVITKFSKTEIKNGHMHPREYASLKYKVNGNADTVSLCLAYRKEKIQDTKGINEKRKEFLLPSYECDYNKHLFAHEHNLQLTFGMFNATR